jgi:outer membrane lipoprotein-sorting protein
LTLKRYYIILGILIFIVGCAGFKETTKIKLTSPKEINNYLKERDSIIQTFNGSGDITIETPENANNARFTVKIKKPDSLMIDLKGPFGISVGTLILSRISYVFYNNFENRVQRGSSDNHSLRQILNFDFSFDNIVNLFTGSYLYSNLDFSKSILDTVDNHISLKEENLTSFREIIIDSKNNNTLKYTELDKDHTPYLEATAKRYKYIDGVSVPFWIRVILPQQSKGITIAFDNIEINKTINFGHNFLIENDINLR